MTPSVLRVRVALVILLALTLLSSVTAALAPAAQAAPADPCGAAGNVITCENSLPGSPASEWDVVGAGDDTIQGFATDISVNAGSRLDFKIDTAATAYSITIYRSGWYGGLGARKIATLSPTATLPQTQPACITDVTTELYDCGNWAVSGSWDVPADAASGVYFARLQITAGATSGDASHVPFVVRNDASTSAVVFQTSDTTWQAYNTYGGASFYQGAVNGRGYKLSYNRPFSTRGGPTAHDYYFANEYPMVRFMERNGYDVSYISGVDADRAGDKLLNHKVYLSVGHDEYWSARQRKNVEAARDAGVNLQFLSGNEAYWHVRWEPSADASHTDYRTLVSYKETWSDRKIDPSPEWTGTWRDPRFAPQSAGAGLPENALTGAMYMANSDDLAVKVSAAEGKLRLWRNTALATLPTGGSATLAQHTVGYESDEDLDNGFRPEGLVRLSTTTGPTPEYLTDFGRVVRPGTTTHHLTLYKAPSGALVFSAGSIQYTWGLDAEHDTPFAPEPADIRMQQAQVNLFADMGVQPATLMDGLVAATRSTDNAGPTVTIASPAEGDARANGTVLTVSGTATDVGAGQVAGVEVSTDSGDTWHPASGTTSWTYSAVQHGVGADSIRVRAVDDSANIGTVATRGVTVTCPCSIFGATTPANPSVTDASAVELGLRFTPTVNGVVNGVRFYKGTRNTGTHTGRMWASDGTLLSSVTFSGESATGWQAATFAVPVEVEAGTTYVVSYTSPQGGYAADESAFSSRPLQVAPFRVAGGYGAAAGGVYGDPDTFPSRSYGNPNYYVDVLFESADNLPLSVSKRFPADTTSSVARSSTVRATYSRPIVPSTAGLAVRNAAGIAVPGATSYDEATRTITFTPDSPLPGGALLTAQVTGTDTRGNQVAVNGTWSFTPAVPQGAPGVCPCSLFSDELTPVVVEDADHSAVTLGVRFAVLTAGTITGIRFYKGVNNTDPHTGALWSASGQQLASGSFAPETVSGWQTLVLDTPVPVVPGVEYVASYRTSVGRYSTGARFSSADLSRTPLRVSPESGAFTYGTGFPGSTSSANYLVDVVFKRPDPTLSIAGQSPRTDATAVPRSSVVRTWFSDGVTSAATLAVTVGGSPVAGTQSLDTDGTLLSFVPTTALPADTLVSVELRNIVSVQGVALADRTWSFRTEAADAVVPQTLLGESTPGIIAVDDPAAVEVGTAFTPTKDGYVRALRFHKGTGNAGTHVGSLWSLSGTLLAQVTYTDETPTGWQRVVLPSPVAVTAGQTYVVSYLAPQGHYSATPGYFSSPVTVGDLIGPAGDNGRYLYGTAGGFPTASYQSTSYGVDVEFVSGQAPPTVPPLTVVSRTPAPNATGVAVGAQPSIALSAPIASGWSMSAAVGSTPVPGTAALSPDATTLTFTPVAALSYGATVTVSVSGLVSQAGATLATQSWSFTTVPPPPVTVTSQAPVAGATNVAIAALPSIALSSPIATGWTMTAAVGSTPVPGTAALSTDGTTLTFTPASALPYGATVTMTVGGVVSQAGAALATQTWSFSTVPPPPVTVVSQTPASGATNVAIAAVPGITFNTPIATGWTMTAAVGATPLPGTAVLSTDGTTLTFTPTAALPYRSTVTITVAGVVSRAGATLPTRTWSFATVQPTISVVAQTPPSGSTAVASATRPTITFSAPIATGYAVGAKVGTVTLAGTTALSTDGTQLVFTPTVALPNSATVTMTVSGVVSRVGAILPTQTWSFSTAAPVPTPAAGSTGVDIKVKPTVTYTAPIRTGYTASMSIGGAPVAGAFVLGAGQTVVTFNPSKALPNSALVTMTVSGVVTTTGVAVPTQTWTFTTSAATGAITTMFEGARPATDALNDARPIEVGLRFSPRVNGQVTAIRFYKGAGNGGTHTGSLWTQDGVRLATGTFVNETASGWQTLVLSTPVNIVAGTQYLVSYYAPQGRVSITDYAFLLNTTYGDVNIPGLTNGKYVLRTGGGFPGTNRSATNFFVGVVFRAAS